MELEKRKPYYFTQEGIERIEEMRDAVYMGFWCGKTKAGSWAEKPLDVFYQPNPNVEAGHTHYFGLILNPLTKDVMITDASSCFAEPITGLVGTIVLNPLTEQVLNRYSGWYYIVSI